MITAVVAIISLYLAVRFALSEASQRLRKFQEIWERIFCSVGKNGVDDEADERICIGREFQTKVENQNRSAGPPRRKSGVVNGKTVFRRPKIGELSRIQLRLPFMDAGNLFQSAEKNEMSSNVTDNRQQKSGPYYNTQSSGQGVNDNTLNMFKVPTENRSNSLFTRIFHHVSFIVQRSSTLNYPDVSEKVLSSERVKNAIKTAVMEDLKGQDADDSQIFVSQITHKQRAIDVLQNMRSCISSFLLKIASWVMYKVLGRMLDGIEVHKEQVETIRRASQNNVPIIYLPLHRSHLDYILVTFILYMNDLRAPLVAAGNNLMIPFFGSLLRGLGAFFIKRKLDPQNGQRDFVYRAILHTYMEASLKEGHSLEFFIEGGRSRTGKAVLPKAGLLSIVVDTLVSGGISDAYIVPIAMSYEKLLDGNFISEQMGRPKEMESFTSAVKAIWRTLHSNFGTVRVDFCQPFSLKEFLLAAEYSYNMPSRSVQFCAPKSGQCFFNHNIKARRRSEYGTEIVSEDHRQVIKDLADYIVYDAFNINPLMSTNILAFLLVTKYRKGTTYQQLISGLNWLREEITKRNKTINFTGDSSELLKKACRLLGKGLIKVDTIQMEWSSENADNNVKITFYKPAVTLTEVLELQYYANSVLPVFLLESVIVNAFCVASSEACNKLVNPNKGSPVQRRHILKYSLELCSILQYEFIFSPPGTSLCTVLNATIDDLISNNLFSITEGCDKVTEIPTATETLHDDIFAEEDESEIMDQNIIMSSDEEQICMLQFLKCVLGHFIESYWLSSSFLPYLVNREVEESCVLQEMKWLGQKKLQLGRINYEEALGLDALKNSLKLFESWKILKNTPQGSKKLYSLYPCYNSPSAVEDIIARIEKYKK